MNGNSSFSKIFLIFVWLMLGVGSAFAAWDGSIATTAPRDTSIEGKTYYLIDSEAKLAWFAAKVNATTSNNANPNSNINAILMNDLDLNGHLWTPIAAGKGDTKFSGIFDGNGHKISGMYIDGSRLVTETTNVYCAKHDNKPACNAQNLGFVGTLGGGTIKNLILENVDIHATTNAGSILAQAQQISVGAFVGWMSDKVDFNRVETCMVTGSIRTTGKGQGVGGIVGNAKIGEISNCLSLVEIMTSGSDAYIGGIIGITKENVTVQSCVYAGPELKNIGTNGAVGGITGNVVSGKITVENDYYEGNQLNGIGKDCGSKCTVKNTSEKVLASNKEEIACKLNGGKYNDATCDKTGAWSIGETTLSLFDYGVDGYKIYFYANGGKFADGSEAKYKFLDVGMTITPEDIEAPSHDDKTFIGWSLERNATEPAANLGTVSESDTVFAVWQPKLTVTFNVFPGLFPDENVEMKAKKMDKGAVVTVGSLGTLPTSYCKTPSSTGDGCDELLYFTGWAEKVDPVESDTIHLEDFYAYEDIALYAVWTDVETYTVTYNANGHGKTRVDYVRVGKGKRITVPVDPVAHDGYEFVGWFTDASCVNPFDFTTKIHESIILYAKWKPINYKITYEVGEGFANADNPNEYNVESETINLKAPTPATGYSFDDWFTDDAFSKKVTKIAKGSTGDKAFYAKWSTKTYRITYLADNNSYGSVSDQIKDYGKTITLLFSGIFRRNDCEQTGWATSANGKKVYDLGSIYSKNDDLTLFPSWKALHTYKIEYVCDGCINDPKNPTEYTALTSSGIKNPSSVPEGYKFGGWFKEYKDGAYKNQVNQISAGTIGDMKLYGKLNKAYKITYIGTDNPQSDTTYTGEKDITLREPAKSTGYEFKGWYNNKDFTGNKIEKIAKGSSGDTTLFAKWTKDGNALDYHTITYVVDGNVVATDFYTEKDAVMLADLTKDGYALYGWYVNEGMTGNTFTDFAAGATDDKIFYAKTRSNDSSGVVIIKYTATYDWAGADVSGDQSFTFTVESENISLPTPTRNGYSFAGWLDSKTKTVITTLPKGSIGDRTLTAQWVAKKYTITYNNLEGATNTNPTTYTIESNKIKLSGAERNGYTFEGWFDSGNKQVTEITKGSTGDLELTAKWSDPIEYSISYELNGGALSECTNPTTYSILTSATTLCEPTKENYDFVGWFTADDIKYEEISGVMTGDLELIARWKAPSYSITYKIGESVENLKPNKYTIDDDNVMLPTPTKDGYTFDGWYVNDGLNGITVQSFNAGTYSGDQTFYAKWVKDTYTITYDIDGNNVVLSPNEYTVDDAVTLPTPTKAGYYFEAWLESGTSYVRTSLPKGYVGDRSFIALWSDPIEYKITYDLNDGTLPEGESNPTTYTVESDDITLEDPTRNGYKFEGWFDSKNNQVTEIKKGSTGKLELTAKWSDPIEYTISYNNVEGASNPNPTKYTIESDTIRLAGAEKDGYMFEYWTDSGEKLVSLITKGSTGDMTLYAVWSNPIKYTISYYNVEGATNTNPTTYTVESNDITLENPTRNGYKFEGWFDSKNNQVTEIKKGSTGKLELTAKWSYTVTYTADAQLRAVNAYVSDSVATGLEGVSFTLASTVKNFVIDGYKLDGWSTTDGGDVEYELGASYDGSNITLYPHWTLKTYTITYDLKDGSLSEGESNPTTYTVKSDDITLVNPTKKGYTFEGWFDSENKQVTEIQRGSTGDLELTAKWSFIPIVTYNGAVTFTEYESGKYKAEIDGEYDGDEDFSISSDIAVESVIFKRKFIVGVPSTITLPFEIAIDEVEGAMFYTFGGIEPTNGVNMVQAYPVDTEKLPANTPYLIRPTAETIVFKGAVVFKKTEDPVVKKNNGRWEFRGVYVNKKNVSAEEEGAIYGMSISEKYPQGYFGRFRANVSWFSQMRAYMLDTQFSKPKLAKSPIGNTFSLESGGIGIHWKDGDENIDVGEKATGFQNVKSVPTNIREHRTYDLKGRLLEGTPKAKGVYYNKRMNKK